MIQQKGLSQEDSNFISKYFQIGDEIILGNSVKGYNNRIIKGNTMIIKYGLNQVWFNSNNANGKYGIVDYDKELIDMLRQKTWSYIEISGCEYFKTGYVNYRLHKAILDYYYPESCDSKLIVDHLNNNGLDDRLENIHYVTRGQNSYKVYIDGIIYELTQSGKYKFKMIYDHFKSNQYILTIVDMEDYNKHIFCFKGFDELFILIQERLEQNILHYVVMNVGLTLIYLLLLKRILL